MSLRFAVVSLWADDISRTAHFYRDVLGLHLAGHHAADAIHFDVGGIYLVIQPGTPAVIQGEKRFPLFALTVDDLDAVVERLELHEVELPWGIESRPGSRWVMFRDPAGNLIELVEFA